MKKFAFAALLALGVLAMIAPPAMAQDDKPFTVHGEVRTRMEYTTNTGDLSDANSADNTTYWPYRVRLAAEGRFGKNVTAWIEFQNAGLFGNSDASFLVFGSQAAPVRNGADVAGVEGDGAELYQGNIKVKGLWSDNLSVTFGRQEITAGTELLLGDLDFYSGISHDGITANFDFKKWDLMLLYTRVQQGDLLLLATNYLPSFPPDQVVPGDFAVGTTDFMGGYATFAVNKHNFDVYILDLRNHEIDFDVMTYGGRYSWNNPDGLFWNIEYAMQTGDIDATTDAGGDVMEAWLGYHFNKKHAIWGKYAAASGDDAAADYDGFIPLFGDFHNRLGRGDWFQLSDTTTALGVGGTTGIDAYAIGYTANPNDKTEWGVAYWDYSAAESFGGPDGLGQAIDLYVSHKYNDNLTFSASGSQLSPDDGLTGGGADDSVYRIYGQARIRF
jgi:hypothetical protein